MARPRKTTDAEILEAARGCFLDHGHSVSTKHIAEEIGISQGVLFQRFGTKDELLVKALAPPERPDWIGLVEAGPDERSLAEQLTEIGQALGTFMESMVPCLMTLHAAGIDPKDLLERFDVPPPVLGQIALAGWIGRAQDQGIIRATNPVAAGFLIMGSLHARVFLGHLGASIEPLAEDKSGFLDDLVDLWRQALEPGAAQSNAAEVTK